MEKTKYKLIYLEWADTVSPVEKRWWSKDEALQWAKDDDYWVCETGFLLEDKKDYILIAGRYNTTFSGGQEVISFGDLTRIPKPWVRVKKILKF